MLLIQYRVIVKGVGKVYEGDSEDEARRKFSQLVKASKKSKGAPKEITLFKDYEIVKAYQTPSGQAPRDQKRRP
jgi:chaperonin GroEL (HSP60 family)